MIVPIGISQHLLSASDINGSIGPEATKPAKGRRGSGWDDNDWDDEDDRNGRDDDDDYGWG